MFRFFSVQTLLKRTAKDRPTAAEAFIFCSKEIFHRTASCYHGTMPGSCSNRYSVAAFFWSHERRYSMSLWRRRWRNLLSQLILSQFFVPSSIASCHFKSSRLELKFSRCFQTLQARMLTKPRSLHSNCSKSAIPLSSWRSLNNQTLQYIYSSVYSLWATGRPWKKWQVQHGIDDLLKRLITKFGGAALSRTVEDEYVSHIYNPVRPVQSLKAWCGRDGKLWFFFFESVSRRRYQWIEYLLLRGWWEADPKQRRWGAC